MGQRYHFGTITLSHDVCPKNLLDFQGKFADFKTIDMFCGKLLNYLKQNGYPFPIFYKTKFLLDPEKKEVNIAINFDPGKKCYFGNTIIKNNKKVSELMIKSQVYWKQGQLFNEKLLEDTRKSLINTNIIAIANIKPIPIKDSSDTVDIQVKVTESPLRTLGAQCYYSTSEGPGGELMWEHRNLSGNGEGVYAGVHYSQFKAFGNFGLKLPNFMNKNIGLENDFLFLREDSNAFFLRNFNLKSTLFKKFYPYIKIGFGVKFEKGFASKTLYHLVRSKKNEKVHELKEIQTQYNFNLISIPLYFKFDTTDDHINPTKGQELFIDFDHYFANDKSKKNFTVFKTYLSHLQPLKQDVFSWFNKVSFGKILGINFDELVPHKRFYMGGIQTMRAYGYRLVGDLDVKGTPYGGLSYVSFISELRYKIKPKLSVNFYHEIGALSRTDSLDNIKLFQGSGLSICYYSKLAPVQIGIAIPWKRRRNFEGKYLDSAFQFYVGVGQFR